MFMDKISPIKENILHFIDNQKIVKEDFYKKTSIAASNFKNPGLKSEIGGDKIVKILSVYPEINPEWLLTGNGEMLKEDVLPIAKKSNSQTEGIPLIPLSAMGGIATGEISVLELECERYVVPMFTGADYLIPVKGSSMVPKYSSGDVVACKRIPMRDIFFQWNKVYVLDTDQGPIIKRVGKSEKENSVKIISENPKYEPFDLKLSQIYAVSIVIGVIRLE